MGKCRVCNSPFLEPSLLLFDNMPGSAQGFPTKENLHLDKGDKLEVYQCSGCGLIQLDAEPVSYYRDVIRAAAYSPEMREFRLKQFDQFLNKYNLKNKKIVEIGCGKGEYLELMAESGALAYGIEHLDESIECCKEKNLNVTKNFIEDVNCKLDNTPFDAFFILNFMEHIPDLNTLLKGISNNLNDDGIGLIEVPNFDMILKNNLFSEFISDHLFYFTKDTLNRVLELNGFEVIESKEIWYDYIISAVVKKRKKLDISHFYNFQDKLKTELHEYIDSINNGKVAIWGAGHQALAVISLTNIQNKIECVLDSAKFKQGKYTTASHLPIVNPEVLNNNEIKAVIVMAASYSDEVAKIIKNDFSGDIDVAILRDFGLEKY